MRLEFSVPIAPNWPKNDNDITICWYDVIVNFFLLHVVSLVTLSCWSKIHVSIITGLEFGQFSFVRDWRNIQNSEIPPSKFCPISGDWSELAIPNLAQMSLMKCYWILQNARVQHLTFWVIKRKTNRGVKLIHPD